MPDFSSHETESAVVADLAALAADVRKVEVEGVPFLAVPDGITLNDYSGLLSAPKRITANPHFEDAESFGAYVNLFKQESTLVIANRGGNSVCATFDYHAKGYPAWCSHHAQLAIKHHEDFKAWAGLGQSVSQAAFGEFIEDHMHNIAAPDGATLKDMVLKFAALKETAFKSTINLQNGDVQLTYIEDSERGTENNAKFPSVLTLMLPVYEGQIPIKVEARVRYRIKDQKLWFQIELVRKSDILRKAFADVLQAVENITEIKPLMGS